MGAGDGASGAVAQAASAANAAPDNSMLAACLYVSILVLPDVPVAVNETVTSQALRRER